MSYQTVMILALLFCMNITFALYVYLRFCACELIMVSMPEEEYELYKDRFPPMAKLNPFGRRMVLYTYVAAVTSVLIVSELYLGL
ncbi:hypothetical protein Ga0123461_1938 [Mariprofundus aestuarium]|uniref:Uncharacterized protein n=1 Tax=Mariprofundus aestuarium TaxID=1921086 RepID=A0A2K8L5U1_MARES|nr:hypothetical protein [Mariprofundus aestuarium]ATX80344.1 hypothetical protein Ga0123461_1938 [Mariprofundus aestuarium]